MSRMGQERKIRETLTPKRWDRHRLHISRWPLRCSMRTRLARARTERVWPCGHFLTRFPQTERAFRRKAAAGTVRGSRNCSLRTNRGSGKAPVTTITETHGANSGIKGLGGRLYWRAATLTERRQENAAATTLVLDVPGWPGHLAGQHVDVRLTAPDGYSTQL